MIGVLVDVLSSDLLALRVLVTWFFHLLRTWVPLRATQWRTSSAVQSLAPAGPHPAPYARTPTMSKSCSAFGSDRLEETCSDVVWICSWIWWWWLKALEMKRIPALTFQPITYAAKHDGRRRMFVWMIGICSGGRTIRTVYWSSLKDVLFICGWLCCFLCFGVGLNNFTFRLGPRRPLQVGG